MQLYIYEDCTLAEEYNRHSSKVGDAVKHHGTKNTNKNTCVSLLARKGVWVLRRPSARIHSFKARRLLLISAPSILQRKLEHGYSGESTEHKKQQKKKKKKKNLANGLFFFLQHNSPAHYFLQSLLWMRPHIPCLAVRIGSIRSPLVTSEVNERKLTVQLALGGAKDELENSVRPRRVLVGSCCAGRAQGHARLQHADDIFKIAHNLL